MSKLAHSHQPTMDELDYQRAIENGDEDCIPISFKVARWWGNAKPWTRWFGIETPIIWWHTALVFGVIAGTLLDGSSWREALELISRAYLFWFGLMVVWAVCDVLYERAISKLNNETKRG